MSLIDSDPLETMSYTQPKRSPKITKSKLQNKVQSPNLPIGISHYDLKNSGLVLIDCKSSITLQLAIKKVSDLLVQFKNVVSVPQRPESSCIKKL